MCHNCFYQRLINPKLPFNGAVKVLLLQMVQLFHSNRELLKNGSDIPELPLFIGVPFLGLGTVCTGVLLFVECDSLKKSTSLSSGLAGAW